VVKGKWAQGIVPRNFKWVIKDQFAVCERPGGYGDNHRRVRREEEIIWVKQQGFTCVISLIPSPHNLHNYDEHDVVYRHRPFPPTTPEPEFLLELYREIRQLSGEGQKLLVHQDELGDIVCGLVAGYLLWAGLIPSGPQTISLTERLLERQLGTQARTIVTLTERLVAAGYGAGGAADTEG
jgi:hypothetical protein